MLTLSSPLDWACSHQFPNLTNCGAEANEPCRDQGGAPMQDLFHDERRAAVAAQTVNADPVSKEDFDNSVLNSGEV